ncbi:MAG: hypothetical protein RBG13Loki_2338 [Promethearchaeota archaeon CR_4]|nr:MAG: hypothetical protein RBG13Loki_2338 [Candidatus Lokiarchaeota archaeon CR_4]
MDWVYHFASIGAFCQIFISFYIAAFLYNHYRKKNLRIILLWSTSFIVFGLGVLSILAGIVYQMIFSADENVLMFFYSFGIMCLILMIFCASMVIIYIEYGATQARFPLTVITSALTGLFIGAILSPSMFWIKPFSVPPLLFISIEIPGWVIGGLAILNFAIIYAIGFGRMIRENKGTGLEKKLKKLLWGLQINVIGFLVCLILGILPPHILFFYFIYPYIGSFGLLIFLRGLKENTKYLIYLKQKVYRLIVFQQGGEVLYIYRFRPWPAKEELYVVSSLTGVSNFLQSTLGLHSEGKFDTIEVTDTKIICEFKERLGFALIVSQDSPILRDALRHIVEKFAISKVFANRFSFTSPEFEKSVLPILNTIVEDIFFFYPEKESLEKIV